MSLPSNNSVGVHAVFCPNTSRISAGYLSIFVSINYLFLTFLHRHDFDVLLTNLIDVSDIIVRNGRQISAVDLEWHWNARFVVGDRFIPPGRIQDLISANSPAKFIAFIKRTLQHYIRWETRKAGRSKILFHQHYSQSQIYF